MNWLNEPQQWEIKDGKTLVMDVPAKTDFWRISHYGFTVDEDVYKRQRITNMFHKEPFLYQKAYHLLTYIKK